MTRRGFSQEVDSEDESDDTPRLRIIQGHPWTIGKAQRNRRLAASSLSEYAHSIRQFGDTVLHVPAQRPNLTERGYELLVRDMFTSMVKAHGIGIAAPQIGVPLRVVLIDVGGFGIVAVNPEVEWLESLEVTTEGCLSLKGYAGYVHRPTVAKLYAHDIRGKKFVAEGRGYAAQALAHETDHINGIMYPNRLSSPTDLVKLDDDGEPIVLHARRVERPIRLPLANPIG